MPELDLDEGVWAKTDLGPVLDQSQEPDGKLPSVERELPSSEIATGISQSQLSTEPNLEFACSNDYRSVLFRGIRYSLTVKPTRKGTGFEQPLQPHQHWHVDVSYINLCGTFYYLCSVLDGYSRFLVHWDLRESMKEADIEVILERAKEKRPEAKPRIISDNGPQFIARDFKEFIRISGMTHVRTSPYYPQSNGKLERWHKSLKRECIRERTPLSLEDAKRLIQEYVDHYNNVRLHSAIGYVTPNDMLLGRQAAIHAERDRKLEQARQQRQVRRGQPYRWSCS
jgi:putative transposase